jgi:hypothetical protein
MRTSGYLKYEFLDNESNKSAYSGGTGTYVGEKSIFFNLGLDYIKKMTSSLQNGEEEYYDFKIGQLTLYDAPIDI